MLVSWTSGLQYQSGLGLNLNQSSKKLEVTNPPFFKDCNRDFNLKRIRFRPWIETESGSTFNPNQQWDWSRVQNPTPQIDSRPQIESGLGLNWIRIDWIKLSSERGPQIETIYTDLGLQSKFRSQPLECRVNYSSCLIGSSRLFTFNHPEWVEPEPCSLYSLYFYCILRRNYNIRSPSANPEIWFWLVPHPMDYQLVLRRQVPVPVTQTLEKKEEKQTNKFC